MKQFAWFILCWLVVWSNANAQDSVRTDSALVDSLGLAADSLPVQPTIAQLALDTLSLSAVDVAATLNHLQLTGTAAETNTGNYVALVKINGTKEFLTFRNNVATWNYTPSYKGGLYQIQIESQVSDKKEKQTQLLHIKKTTNETTIQATNLPLWGAVLPPLVAIVFALIFKEVLLALFLGILTGVWFINGMPLTPYDLMKTLFNVLDTYILHALTEPSHLSVIIFSIMIGGVVAIISRNGGMAGIVEKLAPLARGAKSTQFVAWLLGIAIFFDDYANSLIVGNTMRPLCDRYNISREKLAYVVDSTSAPVAAIAFITTWIGAELGYISDALPALEGMQNVPGAYSVFLSSLSYAFYSFFTIIFMLLIIGTGRDFGAMYRAEHRARTTGRVFDVQETDESQHVDLKELEPVAGAPHRWWNGFLPVAVVVGGTLLGLLDTGMTACYNQLIAKGVTMADNSWGTIWASIQSLELEPNAEVGTVRKLGILVGNADSYSSLLWASLSAVVVALFLTVVQRIQKMNAALETMVLGFKTMLPALLILVLAWALAATTKELYTAEYLTSSLGGSLNPYIMPIVIFFLAGAVAFSTGSSWSTMAILYPIAIPMTWAVCQEYGLSQADSMPILYNVIATVLSASVFGDHCSPISDTTILSSLASNCRHLDHVNTQMPYALLVGVVSIVVGYIATAFGTPFILNFGIGVAILWGFLMLMGKKVDTPTSA